MITSKRAVNPPSIGIHSTIVSLPIKMTLLMFLFMANYMPLTSSYCVGYLRNRDIAGIWRLTSKQSFLPKIQKTATQIKYPMKEFTVYPKKKQKLEVDTTTPSNVEEDILLLLKEDGQFVQYASSSSSSTLTSAKSRSYGERKSLERKVSTTAQTTYAVDEMKGSWALVDGKLILAADRRKDITNIRAEGHDHDTILEGRIVAIADQSLVENPVSIEEESHNENSKEKMNHDNEESTLNKMQRKQKGNDGISSSSRSSSSSNASAKKEDVHLSVPKGKVKIGKFFYPKNHPSFFETPMFHPTATGSFELRQVLGHLNTQIKREDEKMIELFRKKDLMDKRYFITSYPLPVVQKKRKRWSIKYNKYVGEYW